MALADSQSVLPFNAEKSPAEALAVIAEVRSRTQAAREKESMLKPGLAIFDIAHPDYQDVRALALPVLYPHTTLYHTSTIVYFVLLQPYCQCGALPWLLLPHAFVV